VFHFTLALLLDSAKSVALHAHGHGSLTAPMAAPLRDQKGLVFDMLPAKRSYTLERIKLAALCGL